jgi:hypothetical protein
MMVNIVEHFDQISPNIALNILYNTMLSLLPAAGGSADHCCCYACYQPVNHNALPQANQVQNVV